MSPPLAGLGGVVRTATEQQTVTQPSVTIGINHAICPTQGHPSEHGLGALTAQKESLFGWPAGISEHLGSAWLYLLISIQILESYAQVLLFWKQSPRNDLWVPQLLPGHTVIYYPFRKQEITPYRPTCSYMRTPLNPQFYPNTSGVINLL